MLRCYYDDIWSIGDTLFGEGKSRQQRKHLLEEMRKNWELELQKLDAASEKDALGVEFLAECCRITDEQWVGLFHCYVNPRIPGTNNGTEQLIATLKSLERVLSRNPNPGARFIRNAPVMALFVNQQRPPGAAFIGTRGPEDMARVRRQLRAGARVGGVAKLARQNLPLLLSRIIKGWNVTSTGPPGPLSMESSVPSTS